MRIVHQRALVLSRALQVHVAPLRKTIIALLVAFPTAAINSQTVVALGAPDRWPEPFTRIGAVSETVQGMPVVTDYLDQAVWRLDFTRRRGARIGRLGSGPREYLTPTGLIQLGKDSLGIVDHANRRILILLRGTRFLGAIGLDSMPMGRYRRLSVPRSDASGGLYALDWDYLQEKRPDSVAIMRWRVGSHAAPAAYFETPPAVERSSVIRAFAAEPQWAVGADGRIAIVRPEPYSVAIVTPGRASVTSGPIAYPRLRITEAHRAAWIEDFERPELMSVRNPFRPGETVETRTRRARNLMWPTHLPPFPENAVRFAPDGHLWVHRTTADGHLRFDVFDRNARLAYHVTAGPRRRLVGFGQDAVYLVHLDEDHNEFLERYRAPWARAP